MIKNLLALLFFVPLLAPAQSTPEVAPVTEIKELQFPYRKGYHMFYKGEIIDYDRYNFPASSKPATFTYYIADEVKEKERWIVNFQYRQVSDTDTTSFDKTYLFIDDEGMFYWVENDPSNVTNGKQVKSKERKTQGIALPLKVGMKWKSFDYSDDKAEFSCITTDTIIELKKGGAVHCFGVVSETAIKRDKDYIVYRKSTDYYSQTIGKVLTSTLVYLVLTEGGKLKRLNEETFLLDDYYKDE